MSRVLLLRGFIAVLLLLPLAACDSFYGVYRAVPVGPAFDAAKLDACLSTLPHYVPAAAMHWDGEMLLAEFERDGAEVLIGYGGDYMLGYVTIESALVGEPPEQKLLAAWLQLQDDLFASLRHDLPAGSLGDVLFLEHASRLDEPCYRDLLEPLPRRPRDSTSTHR